MSRWVVNVAIVTVMLNASFDKFGFVMGLVSVTLFVAILHPWMFAK